MHRSLNHKAMKKGKVILVIMIVLAAIIGIFLYGGYQTFSKEIAAMQSVQEVREGVFTLHYKGDYGFKGFLEQGGAKTDAQMATYIASSLSHGYYKPALTTPEGGCTTVNGSNFFARNFDWDQVGNYIILHTEPDDGYASIATSNLSFLGFGTDWKPSSMQEKFMAMASIYVPLDGMNEKGLCVADLVEIDGDIDVPDTEKPDLTIVGAIRLVLDYAANVDEAIQLLSQYDVFPSVSRMHHLSLSDASGHSVVVEWKGGELMATPTQVVTNHCLSAVSNNESIAESIQRFNMLTTEQLPITGVQQAEQAIQAASYPGETLWTVIYDQQALTATHYFGCQWEQPLTNNLSAK